MAVKANLILDQGATFNTTINVTDPNGNVIVLNGYNSYSQLKKAYSSINVTAQFVVSVIGNTGQIILTMDSNTTSLINAGRYVYDVLAIDPANNFVRVVEGEVLVTPQVTNLNPANITIVVATSNISATLVGDSSNVAANLFSGEE